MNQDHSLSHSKPIALITGASSGIGRALALELARREYHLIVVSRNTEKLNQLAAECHHKYANQVEIFTCDLSDPHQLNSLLTQLTSRLSHIEVLVNNAGFSVFGPFEKTEWVQENALLQLQVDSPTRLIKFVLPSMIQRGKGYILNVCSIYSFVPVPYQSLYAASKAFLYHVTAALHEEVRESGVSLTALCPGTTATNFRNCIQKHRLYQRGMPAEYVAKKACEALFQRKRICIPGWINHLYYYLLWILPPTWLAFTIKRFNQKRSVNLN